MELHFCHNIFIIFVLLCLNSEATLTKLFHKLHSSFFVTFIPTEITSSTKSDFPLLMNELFEAIGQPRNYDLSAQGGQHQKSKKDETQVEKNGHENGSPSLWEERQRQEVKQRAENAEEWVGSTVAHSVQNRCGTVRQ